MTREKAIRILYRNITTFQHISLTQTKDTWVQKGYFKRTAWWGLNLIERKSSRIAESGFEYLRVCSFKVQSQ